jgi:hypothetical protein
MSAQDFQFLVNNALIATTGDILPEELAVSSSDVSAILDCLEIQLDHQPANLAESVRMLAIATKAMSPHQVAA